MWVDFGAGESILSGHEDEVMRELKKRELRKEILAAKHAPYPLSSQLERLRCWMASCWLAIARRLEVFERAHPLLDIDEMGISSGQGCS